ncbi:MAG TPA: signal peptidase I [Ktedonobacterales bacterium]
MRLLWFTVPKAIGVIVYSVFGALVVVTGSVTLVPQVRVALQDSLPIMRHVPAYGPAGALTYRVEGPSMLPTYQSEEYVTLLPLTAGRPQVCDVVAFRTPSGGVWLKRVVALGPATLEWTQGIITVNGASACPAHVHGGNSGAPGKLDTFSLPAGMYFVVGDNLLDSEDSRVVGPIARDTITGYLPG